ncbi:MAG: glycosyltransferase family 4 protein [Candidatus Roseilinea sp.]|uniref:glycosyltransferase family 4 protein n=1 Tax=Candidatus Roseilinea sp. TaxID=2838777 RepID=UPI004048FB72
MRGEGLPHQTQICPIRRRRLWTHTGLGAEIMRRPPDALFVPAHVLPITLALPGRSRRTRAVVTLHDIGYRHFPDAHPWQQRIYLDWSARFAARHAAFIVADSEATRQDVHHFYRAPLARIRVAYPGATTLPKVTEEERQAALRRFGLDTRQTFALHVGTLQPRKNLRRLVRAWRRVAANYPAELPAPLLVLAGASGWGDEATRLQAEIEMQRLTDSVRLIGYITDKEKASLLSAAHALVFPSLYEGFGFPVLEAQLAGVPVVCSNTSSLPEVAGDGAILVNPLDEQAIGDGLLQAMRDPAIRSRLIAAGIRNVARFNWQDCARVILEALTCHSPSCT